MPQKSAWCWRKRGVHRNEKEAELSVAPAVLTAVPLRGRVVTGNALYAQQNLCRQILAAGGHYLFIVKGNQPLLHDSIALLFQTPPTAERIGYERQVDKCKGRVEVRELWTSPALNHYVDWPGVQRVGKVRRVFTHQGVRTEQIRYFITSLADAPDQLLARVRGHWAIENRLHRVRDVTLGEDASQIRTGNAPQVMAALRNAVIGILRLLGWENMAAAFRAIGWQHEAVRLVTGRSP